MPEMVLSLRVLDVSIGGCALWLPHDVPPMQAGTQLGQVRVELDPQTRFSAALALQHVSSQGSSSGARLGCEWRHLASDAERMLQRWIDRTQQRRRLLAAE
jgi:c-di-GMP-binding flagellar brake protein YcgR